MFTDGHGCVRSAPRIDDNEPAVGKIPVISGRERGAPGACNGGNHGIELADRFAQFPARGGDFSIGFGAITIERDDMVRKILIKHCFRGQPQGIFSRTIR